MGAGAIEAVEELANLLLGRDGGLNFWPGEMALVAKLREARDCLVERDKGLCRRLIGRANGEDVRDEVRVPKRDAIDDTAKKEAVSGW